MCWKTVGFSESETRLAKNTFARRDGRRSLTRFEAAVLGRSCGHPCKRQWRRENAPVKKKKKGVSRRQKASADLVSPFRDRLWELFRETASGMDGADVVRALKQASEEIWAVGIDETYTRMSPQAQDAEPLGNAFDITWLTVVCIKLKEIKQGRKPKMRIRA